MLAAQVGKYFGLEDADLPAVAVHVGANDAKYFLKHAKPSGVAAWLDDFEVRPKSTLVTACRACSPNRPCLAIM